MSIAVSMSISVFIAMYVYIDVSMDIDLSIALHIVVSTPVSIFRGLFTTTGHQQGHGGLRPGKGSLVPIDIPLYSSESICYVDIRTLSLRLLVVMRLDEKC
jgi:hypothetical protein